MARFGRKMRGFHRATWRCCQPVLFLKFILLDSTSLGKTPISCFPPHLPNARRAAGATYIIHGILHVLHHFSGNFRNFFRKIVNRWFILRSWTRTLTFFWINSAAASPNRSQWWGWLPILKKILQETVSSWTTLIFGQELHRSSEGTAKQEILSTSPKMSRSRGGH